jgi:signal transduction histidine kinase
LLRPAVVRADVVDSLRQVIAQAHGNVETESDARWSMIAALGNEAMDSLLLEEAPQQMTWFMQHQQWERYYDTWDSKVNVYIYSGRLQTALREAQTMLDDASSRNDRFGLALACQSMGIIYESMGLHDQAVGLFSRCISQLKTTLPDAEVLTSAYDYLCQTLDEQARYGEELDVACEWEQCVLKRIAESKKMPAMHYPTYVACLSNKASALTGLRRYDEAAGQLQYADRLLGETSSPLARYRVLYVRVRHEMARGNWPGALSYCDSLEALNIDVGGNTRLQRAEILLQLGRGDEAARILLKEYHDKDTTFTRDMRMQLDELNTLYQVEELHMQTQLERSRFLAGIIGLVALALLLFIAYRHRAAKRLEAEHLLLQESTEKLEQSYRELKTANARAEESSRMKTNFIQQISHEIRTPLNVLSGFTQIVTSPSIDIDEATRTDAGRRIMENADRIAELVNKMLELSDASSQTVVERTDEVTAGALARQAIQQSGIAAQSRLSFTFHDDYDTGEQLLLTNQRQACRVLALLLGNALKFTQAGSVTLTMERQGRQLCFAVADTGIGVPAAEAEHIFEEFVQLDEYYDGAGIGLTVARSLARRMGGDVVLDTDYTGCACFVFSLPVA